MSGSARRKSASMRIRATQPPARCGSSIRITAERSLRFFAYGLGELQGAAEPATHSALLDWFAGLGIPVARERAVVDGISACLRFYQQ